MVHSSRQRLPRPMKIGAQIPERTFVVRGDAMKVFSLLTRDPNPIHWDVAAVRALGLGERAVNQGGLNVGYVLNVVAAWAGSGAAIREVKVRFLGSACEGDEVVAGGEIADVEAYEGGTRVSLHVWLRDASGAELVSGTARAELPSGQAAAVSSS